MGCWEILRCLVGGGEPRSFGLAEGIKGVSSPFLPIPWWGEGWLRAA